MKAFQIRSEKRTSISAVTRVMQSHNAGGLSWIRRSRDHDQTTDDGCGGRAGTSKRRLIEQSRHASGARAA
jgi:hypothetical protein